MIYIPLSRARAGMVLAKSIPAPNGIFSLLVSGEKLTDPILQKLGRLNIDGVYIEVRGSEDIAPTPLMPTELKQQITMDFRSLYLNLYSRPSISHAAVDSTRRIAETIVDCVLGREEFLLDMMEIKGYDNYTYSHSLNVGLLSILLAHEIGITRNQLEDLALCALMHDVGKIDIPIEIINKTGPITDSEFAVIKTHPEKGVERLRKCYNISREVLQGIQSHHEKIDGTGYPFGTKSTSISLFGRILAVADVYDALTSHRSYRKAWRPSEAIEYILAGADTQFDYNIVQVFMRIVCAYPTGTIVRLSDESMAVVVKNRSENVLRPRVRLIEDSALGEKGTEIDLLEDSGAFHLTIVAVFGGAEDEDFVLPGSI